MTTIRVGALIDGTGAEPLSDVVVTVAGDRIAGIAEAASFDGVADLDCSALTAIPGMVDCHDHLLLDVGDEAAQAGQSIARLAIVSVANARKLVQAGITTMRELGSKGGLDVELRQAIAEGEIPGPRLFIAGHVLCRTGGHAHFMGREVNGADDMRKAVREQIKLGADEIKIMVSGGMSTRGSSPFTQELTDDEIIAAIEEAHRAGLPIAGHGHGGPGVEFAARHGIDTIEHGICLERDQVKALAEAGTTLISTVAVSRAVYSDPNTPEFYRAKISDSLERAVQVLRWAREFGVTVAVGCDTAHARFDLEMAALVEAGFSPLEAIRAMTLTGAEVVRQSADLGSIEVGKIADIVFLRGDPLESSAAIRSVDKVMQAGNWVGLSCAVPGAPTGAPGKHWS
ncbi:MAG: amidohydrolase family protein [Bifidobacteriaceae bacterium]|jgi:imidazolonepropionase-like amidohydrolase|nr:amidohydrolase family protein [Bifidobacteriaceae bacterium]